MLHTLGLPYTCITLNKYSCINCVRMPVQLHLTCGVNSTETYTVYY